MSTPADSTPREVTPIIMRPMMTVPMIIAPWSALVFLKPMQRTADWGRTNVKMPTSSHCVKYSDAGMEPPPKGSSISGRFARMVSMMFS